MGALEPVQNFSCRRRISQQCNVRYDHSEHWQLHLNIPPGRVSFVGISAAKIAAGSEPGARKIRGTHNRPAARLPELRRLVQNGSGWMVTPELCLAVIEVAVAAMLKLVTLRQSSGQTRSRHAYASVQKVLLVER